MAEKRAAGELNIGTRGNFAGKDASGGVLVTPPENAAPTLEQLGIDKNLQKRSRAAAALPEAEPGRAPCAGAQTDPLLSEVFAQVGQKLPT
jgi:hypothetical protein